MQPTEIDRRFQEAHSELTECVSDLHEIGQRLAQMKLPAFARGSRSFKGLSWRCQGIAHANLLRGEELLRFTILALNEGAIITAYLLLRALDETVAALVFARLKIQRAVNSKDRQRVVETTDRLTSGNRFMAERGEEMPRPYNVLTMVDETRNVPKLDRRISCGTQAL